MKCIKCGFESQDAFNFCPICGVEAPVYEESAVSINPAADRALAVIKDKLFLVICILMSVSCVFSISSGGLPLINILITVFLWLTFAKGCKNIADNEHLRCISGSVYAYYVIMNVAAIILIVCGVIVSFSLGVFARSLDIIEGLMHDFDDISEYLLILPEGLLELSGWLIGFIIVSVSVICLVFNILGIKKIHKFLQSVYRAVETGNPVFENPKAAKNWLIFFAVCIGISAFSNYMTTLSMGALCAAVILAVILINKYFLVEETI